MSRKLKYYLTQFWLLNQWPSEHRPCKSFPRRHAHDAWTQRQNYLRRELQPALLHDQVFKAHFLVQICILIGLWNGSKHKLNIININRQRLSKYECSCVSLVPTIATLTSPPQGRPAEQCQIAAEDCSVDMTVMRCFRYCQAELSLYIARCVVPHFRHLHSL